MIIKFNLSLFNLSCPPWLILGLSVLSGCTVGPDFEKPVDHPPEKWADLPAQQQHSQAAQPSLIIESSPDQDWWRQFNDALLSSLIDRAIQQNLTLRTATTLLAQSRAQRGIAGADQFPLLNGNASYSQVQSSQKGILNLAKSLMGGSGVASSANGTGMAGSANGSGAGAIGLPAAGIAPFSLYQYGFDAGWELDLWGRVRREQEAAEAGVEAAREQHYAAQLSVIAEVARNYIELRRLQNNRIRVNQQQDIAQEQLDLTTAKAMHGVVTDIDVEAAKARLANLQAQLPQFDQQIEQTINQLSLLISSPPGTLMSELTSLQPVPAMPAVVAIGLPSELAMRRPDIREAEANLHRALANIGMATADFYPRFTLSGSTGLQALRLQDLASGSAWQYAMGPAIMLPIFQGGRLLSTLELRRAEHQQAAVAYRNTLLTAWHEIDNGLSAFHETQQRQQALQAGLQSNSRALSLEQQRYQQGLTDFLPVLQAKAIKLQAEQAEIDGAGSMATNLIALYKALGGGWLAMPEPDGSDKTK